MDICTTGLHQVVVREAAVIDVVKHQSSFSVVPIEMKVFEAKPTLNISNNLFVLRCQHMLLSQLKDGCMENTHRLIGCLMVRVFLLLAFLFFFRTAKCTEPYDVSP